MDLIMEDLQYETDSEAEAEAQAEGLADSNAETGEEESESDDEEYVPTREEAENEARVEAADKTSFAKVISKEMDLNSLKENEFNSCLSRLEKIEREEKQHKNLPKSAMDTPATSPRTQKEADEASKKHKVACFLNVHSNIELSFFYII